MEMKASQLVLLFKTWDKLPKSFLDILSVLEKLST